MIKDLDPMNDRDSETIPLSPCVCCRRRCGIVAAVSLADAQPNSSLINRPFHSKGNEVGVTTAPPTRVNLEILGFPQQAAGSYRQENLFNLPMAISVTFSERISPGGDLPLDF